MHPILQLVNVVLDLYSLIIMVYVILRLLIYFQIVNLYQPFVNKLVKILADMTEPVFNYIRRYIPTLSNVDLAPLVLLIAIYMVQYTIIYYFGSPVY